MPEIQAFKLIHTINGTTVPAADTASDAVSPAVSGQNQAEEKFTGIKLILGSSDQSDLKEVLGFSDAREFGKLMMDPKGSMLKEWLQNGSPQDKQPY